MLLTSIPQVFRSNLGQGTDCSYWDIHVGFQVLTAVVIKIFMFILNVSTQMMDSTLRLATTTSFVAHSNLLFTIIWSLEAMYSDLLRKSLSNLNVP
jgi:hypothetical protein